MNKLNLCIQNNQEQHAFGDLMLKLGNDFTASRMRNLPCLEMNASASWIEVWLRVTHTLAN